MLFQLFQLTDVNFFCNESAGELIGAEGAYKKDGERLFTRACCDMTRGNGFKQKEGRCMLDKRKKLFTTRVMRHWNRL